MESGVIQLSPKLHLYHACIYDKTWYIANVVKYQMKIFITNSWKKVPLTDFLGQLTITIAVF